MGDWTIPLADGRILGGAECGDPQGRPVFLFHGQPGNRLFHPNAELTREMDIRLIVPDRPGYGLSTFQENRRLLDWPKDVTKAADHFKIQKFEVIGFSGGGPYALACAAAIPERLTRVCVVSGAPPMHLPSLRREMSPLVKINYWLTRCAPGLFAWSFRIYWQQARKKPESFIEIMRKQSPAADREIMADPEIYKVLLAVWKENLRVDSKGYVRDAEILMKDWGFSLDSIKTPVELWWGEQDQNVPPLVMEFLAAKLPSSTQNLMPDAGHLAIQVNWEEIISD